MQFTLPSEPWLTLNTPDAIVDLPVFTTEREDLDCGCSGKSLAKGYQEKVGVEDAILYLLHRVHSHLDKKSSAVRTAFFDFPSTFNTIRPLLLRDKLTKMRVDPLLVTWITDCLTERPQYFRLKGCTSYTVVI